MGVKENLFYRINDIEVAVIDDSVKSNLESYFVVTKVSAQRE
jgi:hypothetical protein